MTEGKSHFELCDLTEGQGLFQIQPTPVVPTPSTDHDDSLPTLQCEGDPEPAVEGPDSSRYSTRLCRGVQFQTGRLVWGLSALPQDQVLTIKMFSAARESRLEDLQAILEHSQCSDQPIPFVFVTPPPVSGRRVSQYKFSTVSIVTETGEYYYLNAIESESSGVAEC